MIKNYDWISLQAKRAAYGSDFVQKSYADADLEVKNGEIIAVVSTDSIDREGEIVLPKGVDLSDFRKQPGVYLEHNTDALPLGPCVWIKAEPKRIIAKYRIVENASPEHKAISELVKAGALRSHSIGFLSANPSAPSAQELRFHPEWQGAKKIHRSTKMLEFSLTGMPCNPDAVALAVAKGGFSERFVKALGGVSQETKEGTATAQVEMNTHDARELYATAVVNAAKSFRNSFDVEKALAAAMNRLRR